MGYAQEILKRFTKFEGRQSRQIHYIDLVICAYCLGTGVDPKYGEPNRCPICSADGKVRVTPPVVTCLKCNGSGREAGDMVCLTCRGTGFVSVRKEATLCPRCKGTGEEGIFYCNTCKGQGIV